MLQCNISLKIYIYTRTHIAQCMHSKSTLAISYAIIYILFMRYVLRFLWFVFVSFLRRNDDFVLLFIRFPSWLLLLHIFIQFIPNLTASWAREKKIAQTYVRFLLLFLLCRFLSLIQSLFSLSLSLLSPSRFLKMMLF